MVAEQVEIDPKQAALIEFCRSNPVFYIEYVLNSPLYSIQRDIVNSVWQNVWTLVASANGTGKTYVSARIALAFLELMDHSIVVTSAPTWKQVEKLLWKEIRVAWTAARPGWLGGRLFAEPRIEIAPDWWAIGFSTDNAGNFQGFHGKHMLYLFDEAGEMPLDMWEALGGNMSGGNARFLGPGNPMSTTNAFYGYCKRPPRGKTIHISAYDTPNFTAFGITEADIQANTWESKITGPLPYPNLTNPQWVADNYQKHGPGSGFYTSRILGDFPESGTDALIWVRWVREAEERYTRDAERHPHAVPTGVQVGIDLAGDGGAESVIQTFLLRREPDEQEWQDIEPLDLGFDAFEMGDTQNTVRRICDHIDAVVARYPHLPVSVRMDADGLGKPIVDSVKAKRGERGAAWRHVTIIGINSGKKARNAERFLNRRAEHWDQVRGRFERSEITLAPDDVRKEQLLSIRVMETQGKVQIEPKPQARKRGLPSPDRADAVMFALCVPMRGGGVMSVSDDLPDALPQGGLDREVYERPLDPEAVGAGISEDTANRLGALFGDPLKRRPRRGFW